MKGLKLIILVFSVLCFFAVDASARGSQDHVKLEKISTLEIAPLSIETNQTTHDSVKSIVARRKISTTLRKPICKKWRSKNWNLC